MKDKKQKARIPRKGGVLLLATVLLMAALTAGGTLAWLIVSSNKLTNNFVVPELTVSIQEDFDDKETKSDVYFRNESDATKGIDAYIRVALVPTWEMKEKTEGGTETWNVAPIPASLNDLDIEWYSDNTWIESGGYYYHKAKVKPTKFTSYLITSAKVDPNSAGAKAGYQMNLQVLAEAIQATETAVTEAWSAGVWGLLDTTVEP